MAFLLLGNSFYWHKNLWSRFYGTVDSGNSYLGVKRFRELVDTNKSPGQMQAFAVLSQTDLRDSDLRDFQR
jgi:hypothetical protein